MLTMRCECFDPSHAEHDGPEVRCQYRGPRTHLERVDMPNASVLFCKPCTHDAMESGLFSVVRAEEEALQDAQEGSQEAQDEPQPKSWAPEFITDSSGTWTGNALRFEKREDAEAFAQEFGLRWTGVRDTRAVPSNDEPNR